MQQSDSSETVDYLSTTKKQFEARRKESIYAQSENLRFAFEQAKGQIDWERLRYAKTEDVIKFALAKVDQYWRDKFPSPATILAVVQDPDYPKLRPIKFLADSCAMYSYTNPRTAEPYTPRYSRDVCAEERKRRGPDPKPITTLQYWRDQAAAGQLVPVKYLSRIERQDRKKQRSFGSQNKRADLTYTDIPETIDTMKKRTTVWLPAITLVKLKKLSAKTGAPMAELFRRAVEEYLKKV